MRFQVFFFVFFVGLSFNLFSQEIVVFTNENGSKSKEAIVILPGFGDHKKGRQHQKKYFQKKGYDLYIPIYKDGISLENCVAKLEAFYTERGMDDYQKVHFFSYIVGSWTLNRFIEKNGRKNIATIVYDRSPIQERAPYIANKHLGLIVRIKGLKNIMAEMASTPYEPLNKDSISIGIIVESKATLLMRLFKKKTLKMGEILWNLDALNQIHDDGHYTWLNHDQMYTRFDIVGAEILSFIHNGAFTPETRRKKYNWDPFKSFKKEGLE